MFAPLHRTTLRPQTGGPPRADEIQLAINSLFGTQGPRRPVQVRTDHGRVYVQSVDRPSYPVSGMSIESSREWSPEFHSTKIDRLFARLEASEAPKKTRSGLVDYAIDALNQRGVLFREDPSTRVGVIPFTDHRRKPLRWVSVSGAALVDASRRDVLWTTVRDGLGLGIPFGLGMLDPATDEW